MPLEIAFTHIPQKQSYAIIGQTGYGRMDEKTPADGLATFGASSCTVIVSHCAKLKRTTLTHSPNYMFVKQTLEPIINLTVAKGEDEYNKTDTLEVVVMRGYLYRDPKISAGFNHTGFMQELRDFLRVTYATHSVNIEDTDPLLESSNGSLLVDKTTAEITVLQLPLPEYVFKYPTLSYTLQQLRRDIFAHDLFPFVYPNNGKIITSRHLQFDGKQCTLHGKIGDHCRLVLRARCNLNYSDKELQCLLVSLKIVLPGFLFEQLKQSLEMTAAAPGLPCERCSNKGLMKCSNCRGAWYCDRAHQREDWREHKRFCRLYAIEK